MKGNSVKKQIIWFSLINYIGVGIGILSTLFIYPENTEFLGLFRTIESYAQIIYPIILIGAAQALVHFYPNLDKQNQNNLFNFSVYSVVLHTLFLSISLFLIFIFFDFKYKNLIWVALPLGMSIAMNEVFKRQALNYQKIAIPTLYEKIIPKVFLPLSFILIGLGYFSEKEGFILSISSYFALTLLTGIYLKKTHRHPFNLEFKYIFNSLSRREYYKYSLYAFTGSLGSLLAFRIDTIMLNLFGYSMSEIGIYNIGVLIISTIIIPATGIFAINSPIISKLIKENRIAELKVKYTETAKLLLAIGGIIYACVFLGIYDLFSLLPAKDNLLQSIPTLIILGIGILFNMGTGFNSEIITFSKFYRFNVIAILLMIGLNISLNLLFLLYYKTGMIGVAFSTTISLAVFNLLKCFFIKSKYNILPFDKSYWKIALIITSVCVLIYLLPKTNSHLINLLYKTGLCFSINLFLIYKLKLVYELNNLRYFKKS